MGLRLTAICSNVRLKVRGTTSRRCPQMVSKDRSHLAGQGRFYFVFLKSVDDRLLVLEVACFLDAAGLCEFNEFFFLSAEVLADMCI